MLYSKANVAAWAKQFLNTMTVPIEFVNDKNTDRSFNL